MGLIYFITLIYLIFVFKKKIFKYDNGLLFLLILFLLTYLIPILYTSLINPVLTDRYIIFVLIPIILFISQLTLSLDSLRFKRFILAIIIFSTLGNTYFDVIKRQVSKPEFNKTLLDLSNSNSKNIYLKTPQKLDNVINNYVQLIIDKKQLDLKIINFNQSFDKGNFWLICYQPLNGFNCSLEKKKIIHTLKKQLKII